MFGCVIRFLWQVDGIHHPAERRRVLDKLGIEEGEEILIENGSGEHLDLHLQSSYLLLANILSGKANPFVEVMKGNIKLRAFPRKPIQSLKVLSFLKIPPELLIEPLPSKGKTYLLWAAGSIVGLGGLSLLVYYLFQLFGGS